MCVKWSSGDGLALHLILLGKFWPKYNQFSAQRLINSGNPFILINKAKKNKENKK